MSPRPPRRRRPAVRPVRCAAPFEPLERRALLSAAVSAVIGDTSINLGSSPIAVDLTTDFTGADVPANTVFFDTTKGLIPVELTPAATPLTVANFLSYVTAGSYDGTFVHRSIDTSGVDLWEAGTYTATALSDGTVTSSIIAAGSPVANEYGDDHPNVRGTIAMDKPSDDPDGATDTWFFNVADNSTALNAQNDGGYTTFGTIVGDGLSVMDAIAAVPVYNHGAPLDSIPLVNYTAGANLLYDNLVVVNSIRQASAFTVTSDDPAVVAASVNGDALSYAPVAPGTAHLTVTATGVDGSTATQTFAVTVVDPTIGLLPAVASSTVAPNLVLGNPVKGSLALTLKNTTATVDKGTNKVEIFAVPLGSTDPSTGTLLSTTKVKTNLAPGASQKLNIPVRKLPTTSGSFTLIARTTNVAGTVVTATAGPTVSLANPVVTLGVAVGAPSPTSTVPGKSVTYTLTITNNGNVDSTGKLTAAIGLTADGTSVSLPLASVTKAVRIKWGGRPVVLRFKAKVPATATPGTFQLLATVTGTNSAAQGLGTSPLTINAASVQAGV